jgi:hypothetical protein
MKESVPPVMTDLRDLIGAIDRQIDRPDDPTIGSLITIVFGHAALSAHGTTNAPALIHAIEKACGVVIRDIRDWAFNGLPVPDGKRLALLTALKRFARNLHDEAERRVARDREKLAATA